MTKNKISYGTVFNYICVVLMLFVIVTQFLPFFPCSDCDDGNASLADYVWFPNHHKEITKEIMKDKDMYGKEYLVMQAVWAPIVTLVGSVFGIICCLINAKKPLFALIPLAIGAVGVYGYLTTKGLVIGQTWLLHLIACALVLVCSLVVLSEPIVKAAKKKAASKQ